MSVPGLNGACPAVVCRNPDTVPVRLYHPSARPAGLTPNRYTPANAVGDPLIRCRLLVETKTFSLPVNGSICRSSLVTACPKIGLGAPGCPGSSPVISVQVRP